MKTSYILVGAAALAALYFYREAQRAQAATASKPTLLGTIGTVANTVKSLWGSSSSSEPYTVNGSTSIGQFVPASSNTGIDL